MSNKVKYGPIKRTIQSFPDNGENVVCDVTDIKSGATYETQSLAIEEYNLNVFINSLKLKNADADKLYDLIDKFGSRKYSEGSDSFFD